MDRLWMGLDAPLPVSDIHVGVVGVPYDGSVTHEPGAAHAPGVLRDISVDRWPVTENFIDLTPLRIRDFGDVAVDNNNAAATQKAITKTVSPLVTAGAIPLVLGGDHSITCGVAAAYKKIGVLWIDSHPDLMDVYKGLKGKKSKWNHACCLRRILELPQVDPENVLLLGVRDFIPDEYEYIKTHNIEVIYAQDLHKMSLSEVGDKIGKKFSIPVYISFDIDVLDPAYAPGTGVPIPGGLSSRFLYDIIFYLCNKKQNHTESFMQVAGFDVVEIAPPLDVGQITSFAGMSIIMDMLGYICIQEGLSGE